MKYFTKLKLSGYKSIKDVSFTLQPGVNIFIGPNGSGKSNLLEFIEAIQYKFEPLKTNLFALLEWVDEGKIYKISFSQNFDFDWKDDLNKISLSKKVDFKFFLENVETIVSDEEFVDLPDNFVTPQIVILNFPRGKEHKFLSYPINLIGSDSSSVVEYIMSSPMDLFQREIGFSSLWHLTNDDSETLLLFKGRFERGKSALRNFLEKYSNVLDVRLKNILSFTRKNDQKIFENIQLEFKLKDGWYNWTDLSDGTKRIVEIIYCVSRSNGVILLEEPELGIHPHQLDLLCEFLKEQAEEKQILISTHSPEVLDRLANKELTNINLVSMKKGATQVKKLTPKQREKAKHYLEEESFLSDYWKYSDLEK